VAENKVSVEISLEEKAALVALTKLSREINKTEDYFKKMGDQGDYSVGLVAQATQGMANGFRSLVGGVTVANLASDAIVGVANEIKSFALGLVNAAIEQENAINRLAQSLRASGSYSQEALDDFLDFASGLQQVSIYGDEVVASQLAVAKSMGASNQQAKELVHAAANLSATFGGSLEERVSQLGKTLSGTGGKLESLIPGFKALTEEQLKSGAAFDFVNSKYSGAAANELTTYSGKVTAMKNAYSDLQEEIGAFITTSSTASGANGVLKQLFEELTEKVKDFRIELSRKDKGFNENQESINQLSRQYEDLTTKIEEAQAVIQKREEGGFFESLFANAERAKEQLRELIPLQQELYAKINQTTIQPEQPQVQAEATAPQGLTPADQKLIDSRNEAYALLQLSYLEQAAWEAEQDLLKREITAQNAALELEQLVGIETEKINAKAAAEEQKAALIQDAHTRRLTMEKIQADKELAIEKSKAEAKKKIDTQAMLVEQKNKELNNQLIASSFQLGAAIAKEGSKEQFLIQKAASVAQAVIATQTGAAQALALGPIAGPPLAAKVNALGAINVATILATAIKGYQDGGIVPGTSYSGDNVLARVNSAEVIMNRSQQANTLMAIANGGMGSTSRIEALLERLVEATENHAHPINIDGRAVASAVRGQVQSGYRLF
jgi:hypothetical protein